MEDPSTHQKIGIDVCLNERRRPNLAKLFRVSNEHLAQQIIRPFKKALTVVPWTLFDGCSLCMDTLVEPMGEKQEGVTYWYVSRSTGSYQLTTGPPGVGMFVVG
jgi:hypothetical protein